MSRLRQLSTTTQHSVSPNIVRLRELEFKYLYFKIQQLVNQRVTLTLKYEQIRSPEIHATLMKPLSIRILGAASSVHLLKKFTHLVESLGTLYPGTYKYGFLAENFEGSRVSIFLVFILLLLKYEYMIQSKNNLIRYDLLNTKAIVCEVMAIRMLREYQSNDRVNLLLVAPCNRLLDGRNSNLPVKRFNTLELAVLTKSMKFLNQPSIIHVLDKFYNGELVVKMRNKAVDDNILRTLLEGYVAKDFQEYNSLIENGEINTITNYSFARVTLRKVMTRTNIVPKYQALVLNLKLIFFALLHLVLISYHRTISQNPKLSRRAVYYFEVVYWLLGLGFNFEFFMKLFNISLVYLRKIVWTYVDIILLLLVDIAFSLRVLLLFGKVTSDRYFDFFSLISIVLLPRILSILNNYEFFNMILLSFKRMLWKLVGLFFLFLSLISGFYLSFISLAIGRSGYDIAFDMVKIFFGFTPAVWSNWASYNNLGRTVQMAYLFLSQFIIATILAIVLSQVFSKVYETNKEEFAYFKATNLIVYFQSSNIFYDNGIYAHKYKIFNYNILIFILSCLKFPIVLLIYTHELVATRYAPKKLKDDMKNFTFFDRDTYYDNDNDLLEVAQEDEESDANAANRSVRKESYLHASKGRDPSNGNTHVSNLFNSLAPTQSINTLRNFRSASTDSFLIDELIARRYGGSKGPTEEHQRRRNSKVRESAFQRGLSERQSNATISELGGSKILRRNRAVSNAKILKKLVQVELLLERVLLRNEHDDSNTSGEANVSDDNFYAAEVATTSSMDSGESVVNHTSLEGFNRMGSIIETSANAIHPDSHIGLHSAE